MINNCFAFFYFFAYFAFAFLWTNTPVLHNALLSHAILFWVQKTVYVSPVYQLLYLVSEYSTNGRSGY